jgi:hypothetical protein
MDSAARQKMMNIISSSQVQKEIMTYDDKIVQCVQSINNSKIKRDFLLQFSKEPVEFINKWIASQARDLEIILGESKANLEEIKQTDFYKQPWMKEAIFHYLTTKVITMIHHSIHLLIFIIDTTTYARITYNTTLRFIIMSKNEYMLAQRVLH